MKMNVTVQIQDERGRPASRIEVLIELPPGMNRDKAVDLVMASLRKAGKIIAWESK